MIRLIINFQLQKQNLAFNWNLKVVKNNLRLYWNSSCDMLNMNSMWEWYWRPTCLTRWEMHKTNTLLVAEYNLMRWIGLVTADGVDFLHVPWCEKNHVLSYSLHSLIRFFYHYYYYYYCHGAIDYSHATCFSLGIETSTVLKIFNQVYICIWVTHLHEVTLQQPQRQRHSTVEISRRNESDPKFLIVDMGKDKPQNLHSLLKRHYYTTNDLALVFFSNTLVLKFVVSTY